MSIRVVKGLGAKKRASRATRGASHNPRTRTTRQTATADVKKPSARQPAGNDAEERRRQRRGRAGADDRRKIIFGVAIVMVILIVIIVAAGSSGSRHGRRGIGNRVRGGYRQQSHAGTPIRDRSFRDYMMEHGVAEELKQRKARIEAHRRGTMRRD